MFSLRKSVIIIHKDDLYSCTLIVSESCLPKQPPRDPLLQLVSLQKASGCWVLDPALAAALGKTSEEVEKPKPASVGYCQI